MKKIAAAIIILAMAGVIAVVLSRNREIMNERLQKNLNLAPTVSVVKARKQKLSDTLSLIGSTLANHDVMIVSETMGRVVEVRADVGDHLKADDVVIRVDDELKHANFITAEVNYQKSKKDLERFEALYKSKSLTDAELEAGRLASQAAEAQYIAARKQYDDTRITTPISGTITQRMVDKGSMVQPGMAVANVVDISMLKVILNVSEQDVFKIKSGDKVSITTDVYRNTRFEGKVKNVSSKGDDSHTYRVEIMLQNSDANPLKAGMFVRVEFPMIEKKDILVAPREALVGSRRDPQVYVVENNIAKLKTIVIGEESGYLVEVIKGLQEGDFVVVNGQNNLKDGMTVSIVKQ